MDIEIRETGPASLARYAEIPIRFRVASILHVEPIDGGLGGLRMTETPVVEPYVKDYDAFEDEAPSRWAKRFDLSNWGIFMGFDGNEPVGGIVVAYRTDGVDMLEGRDDLAALWDIRVHPDRRRQGIGTRLFRRAVEWARARQCRQLKIETQNVNVQACRFYAGQGCSLGAIHRRGYAESCVAHEVMLLWYLDL